MDGNQWCCILRRAYYAAVDHLHDQPVNSCWNIRLKTSIRTARLVQMQWDVVALCEKMTSDYLTIGVLDGKYDGMVLDTYTTLLFGGNDVFNNFVQRRKDKWELGREQNFEDVMKRSSIRYNNMVKQKLWSQTDPKDAKIRDLTTLNNQLKKG